MMRVFDVKVLEGPDYCELQARLKFDTHWVWGDEPFLLYYRFPLDFRTCLSADNGDPFLAAGLAPAMLLGETLELPGLVSRKLLRSVEDIQHIYHCWNPKLTRIPIKATARDDSPSRVVSPPFSGLFFSLGIDSSYSLWKNFQEHPKDEEAVSHLICVLGFDVYLWESERYGPMLEGLCRVARELKMKAVPVTTNLREVSDRLVDWPRIYHGAALASIGLALENTFRTLRIASTRTYALLSPWGSHPILDPLWSTEKLAIIHDGCEADRLQKIRRVAESPVILNNLRVCTADDALHAYNCGRCEKCLRTMMGLWIAGALERSPTFPHEIDLDLLQNLQVETRNGLHLWQEFSRNLGDSAKDVRIKAALDSALLRIEQRLAQSSS